jgi:hypothetical protein
VHLFYNYVTTIVKVLWIDISFFFLYNDWLINAQFQMKIPFSSNPHSDNNMDSKAPARPFPISNFNSSSPAISTDTVPTSNVSQQQHPSAFLLSSQSQQIPWMSQAAPARGILPPLPPPVVDPFARLSEIKREVDMIVQMVGRDGPRLPAAPPYLVTVNVPKQQSPPNCSGNDSGNSVSDQTQASLGLASSWSQFLRNNPMNQNILDVMLGQNDGLASVDIAPPDLQSDSDDEEDDENEDA